MPAYAHEALFRAYIQNAAHRPLGEEAIDTYLEPYSGAAGQAAFYRQIAQADTAHIAEVQERYRKPDFPVHLAWAQEDHFIPPERGEKLRGLLSVDRVLPIPNAGHIVQEDASEAVVAFLLGV